MGQDESKPDSGLRQLCCSAAICNQESNIDNAQLGAKTGSRDSMGNRGSKHAHRKGSGSLNQVFQS